MMLPPKLPLPRRDPLESLSNSAITAIGVSVWIGWLFTLWPTWTLDTGWSYALILSYIAAPIYLTRLRISCLAMSVGGLYMLYMSVPLERVTIAYPLQYIDLTLLRAVSWVLSLV